MNKIVMEIRAGEGGADSKLFITNMVNMYKAYSKRIGAELECL
jgi:protein subunit release factor A